MQNIVINMCKNFHHDRLRNDRALADRKSDNNNNNKNNNNVRSAWRPVSGSKILPKVRLLFYAAEMITSQQLQQEAQLLLGDRATRKHAKDCRNGRGNDNLGWNDFQMYFKDIKSGTNRKLVYDFRLVFYSNFCRITHRFWEIWCETVQLPWNMPEVIDSRITWKLPCGHVCKIFGRQWTKEAKIAIFNYPTLI